jgi:hypothetical protein
MLTKVKNVLDITADTVADLASTEHKTGSIQLLGFHTKGDGGGGVFYWDATKAKSEHNGGTVIDPSIAGLVANWEYTQNLYFSPAVIGQGCWVREYSGAVDVKWFGAKGDGVADDTAGIQVAFNSNKPVYIPEGEYLTNSTVTLLHGQPLEMDGLIKANDFNGAAIAIGDSTHQILYRTYKIRVERVTRNWTNGSGTTYTSGWVENNTGVQLDSLSSCKIDLRYIKGFDVGCDCLGAATGFAYNNITLGKLDSNQVALRFKSSASKGWCNNNTIYGGSINIHAGTTGVDNKPRYGVVLHGDNYAHQNNRFIGTCIELTKGQGTEETIMAGIWGGVCNFFDEIRAETAAGTGMFVDDSFASVDQDSKSFSNVVSFGKGSNKTLSDVSQSKSTITNSLEGYTNRIHIPNKPLLINPFVSDNSRTAAGVEYMNGYHFQNTSIADSSPTRGHLRGGGSSSVVLTDTGVEGTLIGVGIRVSNITVGQPFYIELDSANDKFVVRCYDSAGNVITTGAPLSSSIVFPPAYRNNAYEKGWVTNGNLFRVVDASVAYIDIIAGGMGIRAAVKSLQVLTTPDHTCIAHAGYEDGQAEEVNGGDMYTPVAPTSYYSKTGLGAKQGQRLYKLNAASGQPAGWVCTVSGGASGAAGTWSAMANLA